jgi:hypothetical protein
MALADPKKARIRHFLKDGTEVESIEDHVVKMEDCPEIYWRMYVISEKRANKLGLHITPPPQLVKAMRERGYKDV